MAQMFLYVCDNHRGALLVIYCFLSHLLHTLRVLHTPNHLLSTTLSKEAKKKIGVEILEIGVKDTMRLSSSSVVVCCKFYYFLLFDKVIGN